jgi:hypothetical protein
VFAKEEKLNMNKHSFLLIPLAATALVACGNPAASSALSSSAPASSKDVHFVSPVGSPALAFYDQGANANWVSTGSPETVVVPAFATDDYDAIVFDGVSGLNVIKAKSYNYQLASWISGGTFYLVSAKHASLSEYQPGQTIDSFVKNGNASKAFMKLAKDKWNWSYADSDLTFETGVSLVGSNLTANPASYDYFVIAEPVLTAARAALAKQTPVVTLSVVADLQSEWKAAYNQSSIPAAALFVNKTSYAAKKGAIDAFIQETQSRQDDAVTNVSKVTAALDAYGAEADQKSRFGFTSTLVTALQKANKFDLFKTGDITDKKAFANDFNVTLGGAAFADSLFL